LSATLPGTARISVGESVGFDLDPQKLHYFHAVSGLNLT
jgi:hypothetical protein